MTSRYRAAPPGAIVAVRLDMLTALYHRASGQTHLLASPAPEILDALADGPLTADSLLDRLRAAYDLIDADAGALAARLEELVDTGLVERR